MKIHELEDGSPFTLACNGKAGVLLYCTDGSAVVRWKVESAEVVIAPRWVKRKMMPERRFRSSGWSKPTSITRTVEVV